MTDDLRRLAEAANQPHPGDGGLQYGPLAELHEALDPATVLALLDERDELRRDRDWWKQTCEFWHDLSKQHERSMALLRLDVEQHNAELAAANARIAELERTDPNGLVFKARLVAENAALSERITELEELNATAVQLADSSDEKKWEVVKQRVEWQGRAEIAEARIDKALALCASWEREATHWTDHAESIAGDKRAKSYALASKYRDAADQLRAALSDTAGPEDTALDDFRIDNPEAGT